VLNGAAGEAYITMGTQRRPFMELVNIEATVEKNKEEVPILGRMNKGNKTTGATCTGSATIHKMSTDFAQYMYNFLQTGEDIYFDISVTNNDPTTSLGEQRIILKNCNMDSAIITSLDADDSVLDEDIDFTFEGFEINSAFNQIPELAWN
jgi:hypothetical protein